MSAARVKIDSTGASTTRVEIDGQNIANVLVGYDISDRAGGIPNVTLHLLGTGSVELARADVKLRPAVADALIALGWTPPQAEESSEPPLSLGAHLAGLAGDSVFTKPDPRQD